MKKILIVINRLGVGGAERLVVDDVNEMLRRGIPVQLLTLQSEKKDSSLASECRLMPESRHQIPFRNFWDLHAWFLCWRFLHQLKPEVIISHLWFANSVCRIIAVSLGVKVRITFEHNVYDVVKTRKMFFLDKILENFTTKIVAVSETVKDSLLRHGIKTAKISVLHNAVDTSRYSFEIDSRLRNEFNPKNQFTYIFVGRLINQKGVDVLLKAFARVNSGLLLLAGDGRDRDEFLKLAARLEIKDRVHFLGVRYDIPKLLAISDCFVLPSRYEGLPMVLIEAMVSGKAIVVSDFESGRELITDGKNGLVVPRENAEALAQAMSLIQKDGALRNRLATQVTRDAQNLLIKNHVDAILKLI